MDSRKTPCGVVMCQLADFGIQQLQKSGQSPETIGHGLRRVWELPAIGHRLWLGRATIAHLLAVGGNLCKIFGKTAKCSEITVSCAVICGNYGVMSGNLRTTARAAPVSL